MKAQHLVSYVYHAAGTTAWAKAPGLFLRKRRLKAFLGSGERLRFPEASAPRASFIIPVHNGAHHTLECLRSILARADGSYEVIIVDDGSSDSTGALLARCDNLRVLRNPENLGFLRSSNAGAQLARGQFLVLLNNDARLREGSLSQALDLYEAEKTCGYMGARIAHVSGGLQEAGCMIFQDGMTNGYLRYQPVEDLRGLFQRDVDYCSGVFAIVARHHFESLGGFDEAYAPAYFEETDFCMRLRQRGLRCIYNPRLLVDHFEFGSSRKATAARAHIEARRRIFLARWQAVLRQEGYLPSESRQTVELAATRLLPPARKLVVVDEASALASLQAAAAPQGSHVTAFILTRSNELMKLLVAKTDKSVSLLKGDAAGLIGFLEDRMPAFTTIVVEGAEAAHLRQRLKSRFGARWRFEP